MPSMSTTQKKISTRLQKSDDHSHWSDWKWHIHHTIKDIATFEKITGIDFSARQRREFQDVLKTFPLSITPYYLSLIDVHNYESDPIFMQSFPNVAELVIEQHDLKDPLAEDKDCPVPGITHRYPDRVLFHVSNVCSMYCRHCTRKRKVGDRDSIPTKKQISAGLDYIRNTPVVRDVLLSGGDPFLLSDTYLEWILNELEKIPTVEVIRIGTRTPVVLPYRITDKLVKILARHKSLWINTHFNHPREMTGSSRRALAMLADAGIPLGNQSVLLAGINDCPRIIKRLCHLLAQNRVRPYYLYQCDLSEGLSHFRTPIGKGIEIIEGLIGHTSGFAVPTYVVDAPGGGGKIPLMPNYMISLSTNKVILRNYEGVITTYKEPDSYRARFCDRNCDKCNLLLNLESGIESNAIGIERLLSDSDETIALVPRGNARIKRRKKDTQP